MIARADDALALTEAPDDELSFDISDVTGTLHAVVSGVQRSLPAGAVARTLAAQMSLPANTPWALHNARGAILADDQPIGEQVVTPREQLTLVPKAHLG